MRINFRDERGSQAVELVIIAPVIAMLLALLIAFGRTGIATGSVDQAATSAARDASLARNPVDAQRRAEATAREVLTAQGIDCRNPRVVVDTAAFSLPLGQSGTVRVNLSCDLNYSDLALPGLPGSRTITSEAVSSIDAYRSRS